MMESSNYLDDISTLRSAVKNQLEDSVKNILRGRFLKKHFQEDLLHVAVKTKNSRIVKMLINHGFDVNHINDENGSLLLVAVEANEANIVKIILKAGFDTEVPETYKLFNEVSKKYAEVDEDRADPCQVIMGTRANCKVFKYKKLLQIAAKNKNVAILKMLLNLLFDKNNISEDITTALLIAVKTNKEDIVKLLLDAENGNKIHKIDMSLKAAIINKNASIVQMLLEYGLVGCKFQSLFLLAVQCSSSEIVQEFLDFGASVNMKDENGVFPLFHAVDKYNVDVVRLLLKKGASVKVVTDYNVTILQFALKNLSKFEKKKVIINLLIDYDTNINARSENGYLPTEMLFNRILNIHYYNPKETMLFLLQLGLLNGGDPNYINKQGVSLLGFAINEINEDFTKTLLLYGANSDFPTKCYRFGNTNNPLKIVIDYYLETLRICETGRTLCSILSMSEKELDNFSIENIGFSHYSIYDRIRILSLRRIARLLIQDVARRIVLKKIVSEQTSTYIDSQYVKKFYERCQKEIELMRVTEICGRLAYFDLFVANYSKLVSLTRNENVKMISLPNSKITQLFPVYGEFLIQRVNLGTDRRRLLDSSYHLFIKVNGFKLPFVIADHIFSFLSDRDLKYLKRAFKLHV